MDRKAALAALLAIAAWAVPLVAEEDARQVFLRACTSCHSMDGFVPSDRTEKGWELTVDRMRNYCADYSRYSQAEAGLIVRFLITFPQDQVLLVEDLRMAADADAEAAKAKAAAMLKAAGTPATASATALAASPATVPAPAEAAAKVKATQKMVLIRRPGPTLAAAKLLGYVGVAACVALILTGLLRPMLGGYFRTIHLRLSGVLAIAISVHSIVYLIAYGMPSILWFWLGMASLSALVLAQIGATLRGNLRAKWVAVHKVAAVVGLALTAYGPNTQPWRKFHSGRQFVVVPAGAIGAAVAADETVQCRPWSSKHGSSSWWRWPVG